MQYGQSLLIVENNVNNHMNRSLKTPGDCQHPCSCLDHFLSCLMLEHYFSTQPVPQLTNQHCPLSQTSSFSFSVSGRFSKSRDKFRVGQCYVLCMKKIIPRGTVLSVASKTLVTERQKLPFYCITT